MKKALALYIVSIALLYISYLPGFPRWLGPASIALMLLGSFIFWRMEGRNGRALGLFSPPKGARILVGGLLLGITFPLVSILIGRLANWVVISEGLGFRAQLIPALIRVILVLLAEELIYRGYFYQVFTQRFDHRIAAFVSAALWAGSHVPGMVASGMPLGYVFVGFGTFLMWGGCLALLLFINDGSLWVPASVHLGYNMTFSLTSVFLNIQLAGASLGMGHPAWSPETGLLGFFLWMMVFVAVVFFAPKSFLAQS